MNEDLTRWLMSHPVPKVKRGRARHPWRTTPPRCDDCRKLLHPDIDHSECGTGSDD